MKNSTILVTGGAGFIGSNLIERLLHQGNEIICIDNFDAFYPKEIKEKNLLKSLTYSNCTFIEGDFRDRETLSKIFSENRIDVVVHLGAKAGVRPSISQPWEYFDVNLGGTLCLLETMKLHQVKKLVYASSSSVYGNNIKIPYSESDNVDYPISPYAASKKAGELVTHTFHHLHGFNVINLRFFTVYGPRQRPDLAIHKFFKSIYLGLPIDVYGDGSTSRDYTFIDDIVQGVCNSIDYLFNNTSVYENINLGNSSPITLNELIEIIEEVTHRNFVKNHLPMQEGDVNRTYADISKAQRLIHYNPSTPIRVGLKNFRDWYEENHS